MAMSVPPWSQVAKESPPLIQGQAAPEIRNVRPQAVDDAAPVPTVALGSAGAAAQPTHQPNHGGGARQVLGGHFQRLGPRMYLRQQSPPRDRPDRSAVAFTEQRLDDVDHRQAGADQQHRSELRKARGRVRMPRVPEIGAIAAIRRQIAGREHDDVEPIAAAAGNGQRDAVGRLME